MFNVTESRFVYYFKWSTNMYAAKIHCSFLSVWLLMFHQNLFLNLFNFGKIMFLYQTIFGFNAIQWQPCRRWLCWSYCYFIENRHRAINVHVENLELDDTKKIVFVKQICFFYMVKTTYNVISIWLSNQYHFRILGQYAYLISVCILTYVCFWNDNINKASGVIYWTNISIEWFLP